MNYKILNAECTYVDEILVAVFVTYEIPNYYSNNEKHKSFSSNKVISGYHYLKKEDQASIELFKQIAAYGKKIR